MTKMTRWECERLERICRDREKIAKQEVKARSAQNMADFQQQLAAEYHFDQDDVWRASKQAVQEEVDAANLKIAERNKALGIMPRFGPCISLSWYGRGENGVKERRQELEKVAKAQIDAEEKRAINQVSHAAAKIRVELTSGQLESDAAQAFLATMPTAEQLLPPLSLRKIENSVRQRRIATGYADDSLSIQ